MKLPVVIISSDDDEGNFEEEESEFSSEDDSDYIESDDQDYDAEEENDVESDEEECLDNWDESRDRVVCFRQGSTESEELSLNECKAYLRKHGLRLSGTKEECIQRIKEHERLKDGKGELLYPRSSFSINCTGDVCKGDVVLFKQYVYKKFGKVANRRKIVGKRTVAGRIVKESYGLSKQQHTFTVEVLWSKGSIQHLPPLSTLLVKGRNLYRFGTSRQVWKSEAERSKVLGEKHERGFAARQNRKLKKAEIASNHDRCTKRQKLSHSGPSQSKQPSQIEKQKSVKKRGAAPVKKSATAQKRKAVRFQKMESKRSTQPTFRSDPNRFMYSDNHLQQASSSSFPYDMPPLGFPGYGGHYNNGQWGPNHMPFQPPGYYHHFNYDQHVPRYHLS